MKVQIPATKADLISSLTGLGRLLTAKRWERAAIVYAWTEPHENQHSAGGKSPQRMSLREFAALGIIGLRDKGQVGEYRRAWEDGGGDPAIRPGDTVTLPEAEWKEHFGEPTQKVQARVARSFIAQNPEVVPEAIKAIPAVAQAVADDRDAYSTVVTTIPTVKKGGRTVAAASRGDDEVAEDDLNRAIDTLSDLLMAEKAGRVGPWDGLTEARLRLLGIALNERVARIDGASAPDTISSINEYLHRKAKEGTK